jgi:hypothetical protein
LLWNENKNSSFFFYYLKAAYGEEEAEERELSARSALEEDMEPLSADDEGGEEPLSPGRRRLRPL